MGCGNGAMLRLINDNIDNKDTTFFAVDSSAKQLYICQDELPDIENIEQNACAIPFINRRVKQAR